MTQARAHLKISGIVQGVGFRYFVSSRARGKQVRGWVRNTSDGGVEAVFEGEKEAVSEMAALCREGPPGSSVQGVDVEWAAPSGEFRGFSIKG